MAEARPGLSEPNAVLDELRAQVSSKQRFLAPKLLRDPGSTYAEGWHMCVPGAFNAALDLVEIRRSVRGVSQMTWTQGPWLAFDRGDILYDTPKAGARWDKALKHIGVCYQVDSARSAALPMDGPKDMGVVRFSVLSPNRDRSRLEKRGVLEVDQYDFVEFLINGPDDRVRGLLDRASSGARR